MWLLFWALCVVGCGYRIAGHGAEGGVPRGTMWIAPVENKSDEPLFGAKLGAAMAREAVNRAGFELSAETKAESRLQVWVEQVSERGAAFRTGDVVKEYLLQGRLTAYLTAPSGEILWKGTNIASEREFLAGLDVNHTERNKEAALELLARDLAREVMRRVTLSLARSEP